MPRPKAATVKAYTSSGVPFQWCVDGYQTKGARDANQEVLLALVAWDDSTDFLRDVVGYTTWDGSASLQRVKPLECPLRGGLYCESYSLVDMGTEADRDDWEDGFNPGLWEQDWLLYQLVFTRPKYRVFGDSTLIEQYGGLEQNRYCTFARALAARERKVSGFVFQYQKAPVPPATVGEWATVPDESAFIADYEQEIHVGWTQVPAGAVPEKAIRARISTANAGTFAITTHGQTYTYAPGTLLFKGPQGETDLYQGADGNWYQDLLYIFAARSGGTWNQYLRPDLVDGKRDYGDVRRIKPGGGTDPPYALTEFNLLFFPSNLGPV